MRLTENLLTFFIVVMFFSSCQQEVDQMNVPSPAVAFTADSDVARLVKHTTLRDGSYDNILDGASCISLVLPVTVTVNRQEIYIATVNDIKYVERLVDETGDDVTIVFPVTVMFSDYSQEVVSDEDDLDDIAEDCIEGGGDDDIECIDFLYPLTVSVYNANSQIADVLTANNDEDLFEFINQLEEGTYAGFRFPLILVLSDGTEISIQDNHELEDEIEDAADDCDEDDDDDFDDDDIDDSDFIAVLLSGSWRVSYFFDESDQTSSFSGFTFTFLANGSVSATNGTITAVGGWETYGDDGELELDLDFDDNPFDQIEEEWIVISFNASSIQLQDEDDDDDDDTKALVFERP